MEGVVTYKGFNLRRWKWLFLVLVSLLFCIMPVHSTSTLESPEFPQGLILEYDIEQELGLNAIHLDTYRFIFNNWIDRGSLFSLLLFDDGGLHTLYVSFPDWRAVYSDGTEYGYLKPLWINISTWKTNDNVTIGSKGIFELTHSQTEETDAGTFNCWVARKENRETHYYEHYYYNLDHGALIGHWLQVQDISSNQVTWNLIDTNLGMYNPIYGPSTQILDLILLLGIATEIVVICVFLRKRRVS
jgi:hypothetical protein